MNYAAQAQRPRPAALLGAIGVPAAFGALLVVGLAVTASLPDEDSPLTGVFVTPEPIETPPPPEPTDTASTAQQTTTRTTTPIDIPIRFDDTPAPTPPDTGASDGNIFTPTGPINTGIGNGADIGGGIVVDPPVTLPKFDPVAVSPKTSPGTWVTNDDYRSSWVRREMQGSASFSLKISASGRVTGCSITRSTGHSALDTATCDLITKRARFEPARDSNGAKVAGTYRNTVAWRLPE